MSELLEQNYKMLFQKDVKSIRLNTQRQLNNSPEWFQKDVKSIRLNTDNM